jgi:hypothetical protein
VSKSSTLEDFTRLQRSVGESVYIVDRDGGERFGRLAGADGQLLRDCPSARIASLT